MGAVIVLVNIWGEGRGEGEGGGRAGGVYLRNQSFQLDSSFRLHLSSFLERVGSEARFADAVSLDPDQGGSP